MTIESDFRFANLIAGSGHSGFGVLGRVPTPLACPSSQHIFGGGTGHAKAWTPYHEAVASSRGQSNCDKKRHCKWLMINVKKWVKAGQGKKVSGPTLTGLAGGFRERPTPRFISGNLNSSRLKKYYFFRHLIALNRAYRRHRRNRGASPELTLWPTIVTKTWPFADGLILT
jgi:hypothetical protein